MGLSQTELIFKIILPTVFGVASIAVPLIVNWHGLFPPTAQVTTEAIERVAEEKLKKLGLSPPVSNEEFEKQIKSLVAQLAQKDLENTRLRFERGTERLKAEQYEGAVQDLEEALKILPEGSEAAVSVHFNLGIVLIEFPRGDRESNLKRAIESYKKILSFHTTEKTPERYASAQDNLGRAYWGLSEVRDKEANLGLAIRAYSEALKVRTFEKFPQNYAATQNNLGTAYCGLAEVRDKEANLGLAITAYNEALRVRTLDRFSQDYAGIQNNLGFAYTGLSEVRDKEANLGQAIECYKEALGVYTFDRFPQDYATTQNNLGIAYRRLSEVHGKEANLGRAINAYKEALKVHTREAFPWYFVDISCNLAVTLYMKGDMAEALRVIEEMLPVGEKVGHPKLGLYRQFYEGLKRQ